MRDSTQLSLSFVDAPDPRIPDERVIERFWTKVDRTEEPDACWLWTACKTSDGYGGWGYRVDGRQISMRAHRFAWLVTHGALTEGMVLHHRCETPACVRPDHLIELSPAEHLAVTPGTYVHINGAKTHCKHGHELSDDNLMPGALRRGVRQCRACVTRCNAEARANHPEKLRESQRRYRERKRQERWNSHVAELEANFAARDRAVGDGHADPAAS